MHALSIVRQLIRSCRPGVHAARVAVILAAVAAAVRGRRLTLTELGRAVVGPSHVKHSIKRIDRLLGNRHLAAERASLYRTLAHRVATAARSDPHGRARGKIKKCVNEEGGVAFRLEA